MGCNCGKNRTAKTATASAAPPRPVTTGTVYLLATPGRPPQTFGSALEAEAAKARQGGTGTITVR